MRETKARFHSASAGFRDSLQLVAAAAGFCVVTFAAFRLHSPFSTTAFVYLPIIMVTSMRWGFRVASGFSLAAVTSLDYFFTAPLFSLHVNDPSDMMALAAFEFAGLVVSRLSAEAQRHANFADEERGNTEKLYLLARDILLLDSHKPAGAQVANCIHRAIRVHSVALFDFSTGRIYGAGAASQALDDLARDTWVGNRNQDDWVLHASARVLRLGQQGIGSIALRSKNLSPLVVDAVASIAAVALGRWQALEKESQAEAERKSEQLRAAVLDALAHAFKTPLTAILAASSGLIETGLLEPLQADLASLIAEQSIHLNELATRLLGTARLEASPVSLRRERCDMAHVADRVLETYKRQLAGRLVKSPRWCGPSVVRADPELLGTALSQLIDNAIKFSWTDTPITVSVCRAIDNADAVISVHNMGPTIRREDCERIFDRFYRSPGTEHRAAGTGLGLSITKKIAGAHHGRTWVVSDQKLGTTFYLALPAEEGAHY